MKLFIGKLDVSQFYNTLTIHGDDKSCGRSLEFGVVVSSTDENLPKLNLKQGDKVEVVTDDDKKVFSGTLRFKEKSIKANIMSVKALDRLVDSNMSKGSYVFENKNPADIAKKVFKDCGLKVGKAISARPVTRTFDGASLYDIVYTSYYLDYEKTGKPYIIKMNYGSESVDIVEKGKTVAKYQLNAKENLLDAKYSETSEKLINRVKIFDENGKEAGEVSGESVGDICNTDIYKKEKDEDPGARAKAMLKGIERMASVSSLGDWSLVTGNAVIIKESFTGLNGKFFIVGDTHKIEKGVHRVDLELAFKNIMEEKTSGSDEKKDSVGLGGGKIKGNGIGAKAISAGKTVIGSRYLWGGNNPSTGIDCSGFVQWSYRQAGAKIPGRLTSEELMRNPRRFGFKEVPFSQRQPGDVLWHRGHVAMQYEGGKIIESGGWSRGQMGYSGVAITPGKGRTFSKAFRYVGG